MLLRWRSLVGAHQFARSEKPCTCRIRSPSSIGIKAGKRSSACWRCMEYGGFAVQQQSRVVLSVPGSLTGDKYYQSVVFYIFFGCLFSCRRRWTRTYRRVLLGPGHQPHQRVPSSRSAWEEEGDDDGSWEMISTLEEVQEVVCKK